jgi:hypothetical protein
MLFNGSGSFNLDTVLDPEQKHQPLATTKADSTTSFEHKSTIDLRRPFETILKFREESSCLLGTN